MENTGGHRDAVVASHYMNNGYAFAGGRPLIHIGGETCGKTRAPDALPDGEDDRFLVTHPEPRDARKTPPRVRGGGSVQRLEMVRGDGATGAVGRRHAPL